VLKLGVKHNLNFEDWHTHNVLCRHAEGTCEAYIKKAIEKKVDTIGLSDHFPYSYLTSTLPSINEIPYQEYSMLIDEVDSYVVDLENLRKKFNSKIDVKIAFEIDFFKNQEKLLNAYLKPLISKLDYIIGSVHVLFSDVGIFAFDDRRFLENYKLFDSIDDIYNLYLNTLQEMISSGTFQIDIIGHFDLPKKFNKRPKDQESVMEMVLHTLSLIKKRDLTIEINTSGLRRDVKEQYPSEDIIKKMYEMDIPILLGSDAHHPDEIGYEFHNIKKMLRRIGYSQLAHFDKRKRSFIDI
jgi:histidinol-phosphatase (PHP family)